jgi:hypothetical protein
MIRYLIALILISSTLSSACSSQDDPLVTDVRHIIITPRLLEPSEVYDPWDSSLWKHTNHRIYLVVESAIDSLTPALSDTLGDIACAFVAGSPIDELDVVEIIMLKSNEYTRELDTVVWSSPPPPPSGTSMSPERVAAYSPLELMPEDTYMKYTWASGAFAGSITRGGKLDPTPPPCWTGPVLDREKHGTFQPNS